MSAVQSEPNSDNSSTNNKKKKGSSKETPKKAFADRRFATYIQQRARARQISLAASALAASESLVEHVVSTLSANAKRAVKYGKNGTVSDKHLLAATRTAMGGRLRKSATKAGQAAVETYEASVDKPKKIKKAKKQGKPKTP